MIRTDQGYHTQSKYFCQVITIYQSMQTYCSSHRSRNISCNRQLHHIYILVIVQTICIGVFLINFSLIYCPYLVYILTGHDTLLMAITVEKMVIFNIEKFSCGRMISIQGELDGGCDESLG